MKIIEQIRSDTNKKLPYALRSLRPGCHDFPEMPREMFYVKVCQSLAECAVLTRLETGFTNTDVLDMSAKYEQKYGQWEHAGNWHNTLGQAVAWYHLDIKGDAFFLHDSPDFSIRLKNGDIIYGDIGQISAYTFLVDVQTLHNGGVFISVPDKDTFLIWEVPSEARLKRVFL